MELNTLRVDRNKAESGVWFNLDATGKARILLARWGNENFERVRERLAKPYVIAARNGMLTNAQAMRVLNQTVAEAVILDWEGLTLDGKPFKFSREAALTVMTDPQWEDFADLIKGLAQEQSAFRAEEIEDAAKN